MSRLRRLKGNRRKSTIKTTMASLALTLAIGSTQVIGTYALFTDTVDVPSDLSISTGDADVEVGKDSNITDVQPGQKIEIPVTITNQGTLNQNISLNLDISDEITPHLTYNIVFDGITIRDGIMYNGTNLFVLAPGGSITGYINITVSSMSKEVQNSLAGKPQSVDLTVKSTQVNKDNTLVNDGFYDITIQKNIIMIGKHEENVIYGDAVKVTPASGYGEDSTVNLRVSSTNHYSGLDSVIENISNVVKNDYEIISKNGAFKNTKVFTIGQQWYTLDDKVNTTLITENFGQGNDISIKLKYKDGSYKIYKFDFKVQSIVNGNRLLAVKITAEEQGINTTENDIILDKLSEQEVVEPPKEEVVVPNEQEVVEPPKEEVVVPNEQEVVELPKEEVVVPNQPNIIAPLKEEVKIQE